LHVTLDAQRTLIHHVLRITESGLLHNEAKVWAQRVWGFRAVVETPWVFNFKFRNIGCIINTRWSRQRCKRGFLKQFNCLLEHFWQWLRFRAYRIRYTDKNFCKETTIKSEFIYE